jgi:hypothetical protein
MPTRTSTLRRGVVATALAGVVLTFAAVNVLGEAGATPSDTEHKVTFCHATASYSNPYVVINTDVASILKKGHDGHDGPVFTPHIPKHVAWGDIIPPFDYGNGLSYPGKNWDATGQSLCGGTPATTASTSTTSTVEPTTTSTVEPTTTTTEAPTTTTTIAGT